MTRWTDGRLRSFITSTIRSGFRRYPAKYEALDLAKVGKKVNESSGRLAEHYRCNECKGDFPATQIHVDHILPIVSPEEGFISWDSFINNLFCKVEDLQILCKSCHINGKTKEENRVRKASNSIRKLHPNEESTYRNMMSRCNNKHATGYEYYGGRGISVCDRWKENFYNFYEDMGVRPEGKSLDRIDVNGNYTKDNCRWATSIEQRRNTTANNFIDYDNKIQCLEDWGTELNIKPNTILYRLKRGWPVEEALGIVERQKPFYNGRLSLEDIQELVLAIESGVSQTTYGKEIGMDSSQVSRLYHKFKSKEENAARTKVRKK